MRNLTRTAPRQSISHVNQPVLPLVCFSTTASDPLLVFTKVGVSCIHRVHAIIPIKKTPSFSTPQYHPCTSSPSSCPSKFHLNLKSIRQTPVSVPISPTSPEQQSSTCTASSSSSPAFALGSQRDAFLSPGALQTLPAGVRSCPCLGDTSRNRSGRRAGPTTRMLVREATIALCHK